MEYFVNMYIRGPPSYTPDEHHTLKHVSDSANFFSNPGLAVNGRQPWWSVFGSTKENYFALFLNVSVYCLMDWVYSSLNSKSCNEVDQLVNEVILADNFKREDLIGFCTSWEVKHLDKPRATVDPQDCFLGDDGWVKTGVKIVMEWIFTILLLLSFLFTFLYLISWSYLSMCLSNLFSL